MEELHRKATAALQFRSMLQQSVIIYVHFCLKETGVLSPYILPSGQFQNLLKSQKIEFIESR